MTPFSPGDLVFLRAYPHDVAKKAGIGSMTGMPEKQDLVNGIARVREHHVNASPDLSYVSILMPAQEEHYGDAAGHCAWPIAYVDLVATADESLGISRKRDDRTRFYKNRIEFLKRRGYLVSWA